MRKIFEKTEHSHWLLNERVRTYQESANECNNNTANINGCSIDTNRVQHHVHLLLRSHEEGCAAKETLISCGLKQNNNMEVEMLRYQILANGKPHYCSYTSKHQAKIGTYL